MTPIDRYAALALRRAPRGGNELRANAYRSYEEIWAELVSINALSKHLLNLGLSERSNR